jgi:hypothetical protein
MRRSAKASGVLALQSLSWSSIDYVGYVRRAIIALIVLVTALGGSRLSQRWAIGMLSMVAAALLATGISTS